MNFTQWLQILLVTNIIFTCLQVNDDKTCTFPNFNFNTSHDGNFVAIACEPVCLVGLDVVNYSIPVKESVDEFIQNFLSYFSNFEWSDIIKAESSHDKLNRFYRYSWLTWISVLKQSQRSDPEKCDWSECCSIQLLKEDWNAYILCAFIYLLFFVCKSQKLVFINLLFYFECCLSFFFGIK